jgi:multiple sugar transport system substrate-binding protein
MLSKKFLMTIFTVLVITAQMAACAPAPTAAPAAPAAPAATTAPAAPAATTAPAAPAATTAPAAPAATTAPAAPAATTAPAAASYPKEAPIVVACWSGPEHDNLVKVAAAYTQLTGNQVTVEEIARESYQDKLNTTFVGGGSDYDAAYVSSDWPPAWVKANALTPLDTFFNDPKVVDPNFKLSVFEPMADFFKIDGKVYALPSEGDTAWLWYRKDLFAAKNLQPPTTWDDYLADAKLLNNPPTNYGAVIGAKPDEALWDFMFYLFGMGGKIYDQNYNVTINDDTGVKALTFYAGLLNTAKVVPPDVNTYGYNEILTTLQQGKAAEGIEWMAATQTLTDCTQSPAVCKDGQTELGYTFLPGVKDASGTVVNHTGGSQWGWVIPSGSKNQVAAYKFIEYLTSKPGAVQWALNGGIPSNTDALQDPAVVAKIPQFKMLAQIMPIRMIVPSITVTPDMVTDLDDMIVAAVTGTKSPKDAADEAAAKITALLKSGGYLK